MTTLFWIIVGIIIGWNWPQPLWAQQLQERASRAVRNWLSGA